MPQGVPGSSGPHWKSCSRRQLYHAQPLIGSNKRSPQRRKPELAGCNCGHNISTHSHALPFHHTSRSLLTPGCRHQITVTQPGWQRYTTSTNRCALPVRLFLRDVIMFNAAKAALAQSYNARASYLTEPRQRVGEMAATVWAMEFSALAR